MVYSYKTNKEFIGKTQILLDKLKEKGVWNKDTLVVGLDKSVRPLAYTIRRLSKEEGKDTPDIRYFNYSHFDYAMNKKTYKNVSSYMKSKIKPEKLAKYNRIVILDDYISTGKSMENIKQILDYYFAKVRHKPEISFGVLGSTKDRLYEKTKNNQEINKNLLTYGELDSDFKFMGKYGTGIEDKEIYYKRFLRKKQKIIESQRVSKDKIYSSFVQNRKQLSKDINQYLQEKQGDNESSSVGKSLEKAVQTVSIIALLGSIILNYNGITGNVIGNSSSTNIGGIILIVLGILGFIFSKKFKK